MKQFRNLGDERQTARCTYCGRDTSTRDHVPPRVFLDDPYPDNLPVVPACQECNAGFSIDEEYVACLIDCVISGTASPKEVQREKIRRILLSKPALAARLAMARDAESGVIQFAAESSRVTSVILKLGRGHALFELNEPHYDHPSSVSYIPATLLSDGGRSQFEALPSSGVWPEVGSRAMQRIVMGYSGTPQWIVVQPGRYRYAAFVSDRAIVRMVLSEYLACEVVW